MRRIASMLSVLMLSAMWATAASPESTLAGRVLDKDGQPLPGATLALANDALAFAERVMVSGPDGIYRFAQLPPGAGYRLTVSMPGYATLVFSDIDLASGRTVEQSVVLHPSTQL